MHMPGATQVLKPIRIDNGDLEHICTWLRVFYDILGNY